MKIKTLIIGAITRLLLTTKIHTKDNYSRWGVQTLKGQALSSIINISKLAILLPTIFFLQSCSVSYYKHQDALLKTTNSLEFSNCNVNYSTTIESTLTTNSFGAIENKKQISKIKFTYLPLIEEVIQSYGCVVSHEENQAKSNFMY